MMLEALDAQYLRKPTSKDIQRLLQVADHRGFPRMLGSLALGVAELPGCLERAIHLR